MRISKTTLLKYFVATGLSILVFFLIQLLISQSANLNKKNSNPNYVDFIRVKVESAAREIGHEDGHHHDLEYPVDVQQDVL